jgi:hypothetical protein
VSVPRHGKLYDCATGQSGGARVEWHGALFRSLPAVFVLKQTERTSVWIEKLFLLIYQTCSMECSFYFETDALKRKVKIW